MHVILLQGGTDDGRLVKRSQALRSRVKILIAVTSECCSNTSMSALRRAEGRQTWAKYIWDNHKDADIKFVLAQPPAEARWEALLVRSMGYQSAHNFQGC